MGVRIPAVAATTTLRAHRGTGNGDHFWDLADEKMIGRERNGLAPTSFENVRGDPVALIRPIANSCGIGLSPDCRDRRSSS
jgi:hypothetical protein